MNLDEIFKPRQAQSTLVSIPFDAIRYESEVENRDINWKYVEQLSSGNINLFPPIDVYLSNDAYDILDGQHRWWAIFAFIAVADVREKDPTFTISEFIKIITDIYDDDMRSVIPTIDIKVCMWPKMSAHEVQLFRFWRNRDHGLGSSEDDRKEMAIAIKRQYPDMTLAQIGNEIRRSSTFVSKALNSSVAREKEESQDAFKEARKFGKTIEKLYNNGFFLNDQIEARVDWLKENPDSISAYDEIARQMLEEIRLCES